MRKRLMFAAFLIGGLLVKTDLSAQVIADTELKINRSPISGASSYIAAIEPAQFEYNTKKYSGFKLPEGKQFGFVIDKDQTSLPGLIKTENMLYSAGKNATRTASLNKVDVESLLPVMVAALQEQQKEIEALRRELDILKNRK